MARRGAWSMSTGLFLGRKGDRFIQRHRGPLRPKSVAFPIAESTPDKLDGLRRTSARRPVACIPTASRSLSAAPSVTAARLTNVTGHSQHPSHRALQTREISPPPTPFSVLISECIASNGPTTTRSNFIWATAIGYVFFATMVSRFSIS